MWMRRLLWAALASEGVGMALVQNIYARRAAQAKCRKAEDAIEAKNKFVEELELDKGEPYVRQGGFCAGEEGNPCEVRIDECLANGGFGAVFCVVGPQGDCASLIKLPVRMSGKFVEESMHEARMAAKLKNESGFVQMVGRTCSNADCEDDLNDEQLPAGFIQIPETKPKMVVLHMANAGTKTMHDYLKAKQDLGERVKLFLQLVSSIDIMRSKGIVHRDLKPINIMIKETIPVTPVIIDLGLAVEFNLQGNCHNSYGTPGYVPPTYGIEPWCFSNSLDVYSLGVMIGQYFNPSADIKGLGNLNKAKETIFRLRPRNDPTNALKNVQKALEELIQTETITEEVANVERIQNKKEEKTEVVQEVLNYKDQMFKNKTQSVKQKAAEKVSARQVGPTFAATQCTQQAKTFHAAVFEQPEYNDGTVQCVGVGASVEMVSYPNAGHMIFKVVRLDFTADQTSGQSAAATSSLVQDVALRSLFQREIKLHEELVSLDVNFNEFLPVPQATWVVKGRTPVTALVMSHDATQTKSKDTSKWYPLTIKNIGKYSMQLKKEIADQVLGVLLLLHEHGYVLGRLDWHTVFASCAAESCKIRLLDFMSATHHGGDDDDWGAIKARKVDMQHMKSMATELGVAWEDECSDDMDKFLNQTKTLTDRRTRLLHRIKKHGVVMNGFYRLEEDVGTGCFA